MGFFDRFKRENRADSTTVGTNESEAFLLRALMGDVVITKEQALAIPSVQASINVIANTISSLPIKLYKEVDGKVEQIDNDYRLRLLNHDTGDTLTSVQFWRAIAEDYYLGKGAYVYINKVRNRVKSLNYIDEKEVSVNDNVDPIFKDYDILVQGNTYKPYQFLKFIRKTKRGSQGKSLIAENSLIFAVAYHSLKYEDKLVRKGGNKRGFLQADSKITDLATLKESWNNYYSNNDENIIVLNKGVTFQEASNTSVEMQLNENKETNSTELSMLFNVPNAIIRGNATEQDNKNLIKYAIIPFLNDIECSLDRDLLLEKEKDQRYYWAVDTKELTRGSLEERYKAYKEAVEAGWLSKNEIREAEDREAIEGLDIVTMNLADVIFDINSKKYWTPNTKDVKDSNLDSAGGGDEDEDRNKE